MRPDAEEITCWICLDGAKKSPALGSLCSPCACKGSQGYVHTRCLQKWVEQKAASTVLKATTTGLRCPTCHRRYHGDLLLLLAASQCIALKLEIPPSVTARLANALESRGMRHEAKVLRDQEQRRNWCVLVPEHPDALHALFAVAEAMQQMRHWDAAATLLRRVLKGAEHRLDSDMELCLAEERAVSLAELAEERNMLAVEAVEALCRVYQGQGRLEAAAELEQRLKDVKWRGRQEWLLHRGREIFGDAYDWDFFSLHLHEFVCVAMLVLFVAVFLLWPYTFFE